MKILFFTMVLVIGSITCIAQQKKSDKSNVKFYPPDTIRNIEIVKSKSKVVKFSRPNIVKVNPTKTKK